MLMLAGALLSSPEAHAQDTLDLGTLKNEEITVVQKLLYPKTDKTEIGFQLGALVFDPYMVAPKAQLTVGKHRSESLEIEGQLGFGYGIGTRAYRELGGDALGVRPEAYRYLASASAGVNWSPIYAKMNVNGERVMHHDVYIPIVANVTLERLAWGEQFFAVSPGVGIGLGIRVFQGEGSAIRIELRDDILVQPRKQSGTVALKQNVGLHVGFSRFTGG